MATVIQFICRRSAYTSRLRCIFTTILVCLFTSEASAWTEGSIVCGWDSATEPTVIINLHGDWVGLWRGSPYCASLDLWHKCSPEAQEMAKKDLPELTKYEPGDKLKMEYLPVLVEECMKTDSRGEAFCESIRDTLEEHTAERLANLIQALQEELRNLHQQINQKLQEIDDYENAMVLGAIPLPSVHDKNIDPPTGLGELIGLAAAVPELNRLKAELEELKRTRDTVSNEITLIAHVLANNDYGTDFLDCS